MAIFYFIIDSHVESALCKTTRDVCCDRAVCSHSDTFFAAVEIVSAFSDTCVEIWEINGDAGHLVSSKYLDLSYLVHTFPADVNQDITGLLINSSKPIGVYAGHSCAMVPETVFYCDHLIEQIPPTSELGLTHIAPPIVGRDAEAG